MAKRIIIFTDGQCNELGRTTPDSSNNQPLPRVGDTIVDRVKLNTQEDFSRVTAVVKIVEFDYEEGCIRIFAKVIMNFDTSNVKDMYHLIK